MPGPETSIRIEQTADWEYLNTNVKSIATPIINFYDEAEHLLLFLLSY